MADVPSWLAHLRRDRRGLPIPFVNLWGTESVDRLSIGYDAAVKMPGVFLDDSAETVPDFTRQHMGRQRLCVADGLCQVCVRPVPYSRRVLVVAALSVERITLEGRTVPVVHEPWLCNRCAEFAVGRCPALIRRRREEKLTVVPVRSHLDWDLVVSTGWIEGPLETQSRRVMPAMWAKILLRKEIHA